MLQTEPLWSSKAALWTKVYLGEKSGKGVLGRKIILLYTDDLKTYKQIFKSEVIVILWRVFPPVADSPRSWRQSFQSLSDSYSHCSVIHGRSFPLAAKPVLSQVGSKQGQDQPAERQRHASLCGNASRISMHHLIKPGFARVRWSREVDVPVCVTRWRVTTAAALLSATAIFTVIWKNTHTHTHTHTSQRV